MLQPFVIRTPSLSLFLPFLIPVTALLITSLLASYLQELIVYELFERKYSYLQTFLHYLYMILLAFIQRTYLSSSSSSSSSSPPSFSWIPRMGTASRLATLRFYFYLIVLKTSTVTFNYFAMTLVDFPTKTICKSSKPLLTMLLGICFFQKKYSFTDYCMAILLIIGLTIFLFKDSTEPLNGNILGLIFLLLSVSGAVLLPLLQEHILQKYQSSTSDLLFFSFLGCGILSFLTFLFSGEVEPSLQFLLSVSSSSFSPLKLWSSFFLFHSCGYLSAQLNIFIISRFGAFVNAILNTSRKSVALSISFLFFPEQHELCSHHIIGAAFFFSGIFLKIISPSRPSSVKNLLVSANSVYNDYGGRSQRGKSEEMDARRRYSLAEPESFEMFKV